MELGSREGAGDHVCGFSESTDWTGLKKSTDSPTSQSYSRNGATIRAVSRLCSSCVDGPRLARENVACRTEVACSHVSGLFTQSGWTAGPDGVREPRPHHSSGIDVPMKRQDSLGCVG